MFAVLLSGGELFSQKGVEILYQGKTIIQSTGKAVGTTIRFINAGGKPVVSKSNSIDGQYQSVLSSGVSYYIFVKDYVVSGSNFIDIPHYSKYEEIDYDIYLKPIESNLELFNFKMFEPNDSVIVNSDNIKILKDFMDLNPNAKIEIEVSSYDSWFSNAKKTIITKDKKGKSKNNTITYRIKDQLSDLLDHRINSIKNELRKYKIYLKENAYKKNLQVVDEKKKLKKREIPGKKKKYETYLPEIENVIIRVA
jgi:hypothetical protein